MAIDWLVDEVRLEDRLKRTMPEVFSEFKKDCPVVSKEALRKAFLNYFKDNPHRHGLLRKNTLTLDDIEQNFNTYDFRDYPLIGVVTEAIYQNHEKLFLLKKEIQKAALKLGLTVNYVNENLFIKDRSIHLKRDFFLHDYAHTAFFEKDLVRRRTDRS